MNEDNKFKLIFIGDQSVGKSSIINRYVNGGFEESYNSTIGLDFQSKSTEIQGTSVRLLLYDTAGQEKYKSLIPMYIKMADVIMVVYDITVGLSFTHTSSWIQEANDHKKDDALFFLVGNKLDLKSQRQVSVQHGEEFAKEKGFAFVEVSAKTGEGINELFNDNILSKIAAKHNLNKEGDNNPNQQISKEKGKEKTKGCCK